VRDVPAGEPPSRAGHRSVAVLVPVKAFSRAKHRLAAVLDPLARRTLARDLATRVVRAAGAMPVYVVCDDDDVAAWAESVGATVLWRPGAGLNAAVTDGVATLAVQGIDDVVVAHADLPLATDLAVVTGFDGVTLVTDRRRDGTNVMCLPAAAGFTFAYGPGSFERHRAEATRHGLAVRVLDDPSLAWDVDEPDDLPPDWSLDRPRNERPV
jgi:2-phospho-L-lactate/phosphoenolpyruvate guanylyltransferase